jgi:hypothetical protein
MSEQRNHGRWDSRAKRVQELSQTLAQACGMNQEDVRQVLDQLSLAQLDQVIVPTHSVVKDALMVVMK